MPLDEWRLLLWKSALGDQHLNISGEIYLQWLHLRYKYLAPSEEVISLLKFLRKNYYLALITNGPSKSQWEKISLLKLADYFHCILVSGDLPWEKPSKKIFLEACVHLGVSPQECIMVGDKLETDILGAVKASLGGSVWIPLDSSGDGNNNVDHDFRPDFVITSIIQLPYLLSSKSSKPCNLRSSFNRRLLAVSDPDFEDCNSNSSDGS